MSKGKDNSGQKHRPEDRDLFNDTSSSLIPVQGKNAHVAVRVRRIRRDLLYTIIISIIGLTILLVLKATLEIQVTDLVRDLGHYIGSFFHKEKRKVVLAVFPNTTMSLPIRSGLGFKDPTLNREDEPISKRIPLRHDVTLEFLWEESTPEGTAQKLMRELTQEKDDEVVLVVGHERSSTAQYMLDHVYESDQFLSEPIPLILPAVTNPAITKRSHGGPHILRLPATDEVQVQVLHDLLISIKAHRVTLVVDSSNPVYSGYISSELIAKSPDVTFVDSVGVALDGNGFSPSRFLALSPDTIVFIGMEAQGAMFLQSMVQDSRYRQEKPTLIFTDGVAGDTFNSLTRRVATSAGPIYLTAPFPTASQRGDYVEIPNYKAMGDAAVLLVNSILDDAADRSKEITRQSVLEALRSKRNRSNDTQQYGLITANFNDEGDNTAGQVHVYEMKAQGALHARVCTCSRPLRK